jgi:DNA-binding NarL/FixJ family response regulator
MKKLMLVEDEFVFAMELKHHLHKLGYTVAAIADKGTEAVQKAVEFLPDLILMDISLVGPMNGIEAAAEIRKTHAIPMIFMTAHTDDVTVRNALTQEPFGYLPKPCNLITLSSMIEVALYKSQAEAEKRRVAAQLQQFFADELEKKTARLQESNAAFKGLLEQRDLEKREFEQQVQENLATLVFPALRTLKNGNLTRAQKNQIEAVEIYLQMLPEARLGKVSEGVGKLTDTEIQVANFIKMSKSTKEIAELMDVACSTVNSHRDSIRNKIGIKNSKTNLRKTLMTML